MYMYICHIHLYIYIYICYMFMQKTSPRLWSTQRLGERASRDDASGDDPDKLTQTGHLSSPVKGYLTPGLPLPSQHGTCKVATALQVTVIDLQPTAIGTF